ncbi:MAG: hypothetical protein E7Z85_07745 [Methanosphaera stadtmanae]|nr:hypothetical protein [Methanosphaera stadtmanae]
MEFNGDLAVCLLGYFLAIFFSGLGLIYGAILFILKKDNEIFYEHSRNIMAVAIIIIILRLFAHYGTLLFSSFF